MTGPTLVLSRGGVALYELCGEGARLIDCDLPGSMDDVNWFVDREPRLQQRPQPPHGDGVGFHAQDPEEDEDEDLRRYLAAVAHEIKPRMTGWNVRLVVGAPGNRGARIGATIDHAVNPHAAVEPEDDEHRVARTVSDTKQELLERRRSALRADLSERIGRGEAIDTLDDALESAAIGRVGRLVVVPNADPLWGTFDESSFEIVRHHERQHGDDDLADRLVALTLNHGGEVRPIDQPVDDRWFVAVPRYDIPTG